MRVLWFTNTPSNYGRGNGSIYNGGGWISAAETAMSRREDIELAVSFFMDGQPEKVVQNGVVYYPMSEVHFSLCKKMLYACCPNGGEKMERTRWPLYEERMLRVIHDFKPDIIEVFGSEMAYGLIGNRAGVPVALHIQGILNPYFNAILPPLMSWHDYLYESLNPLKICRRVISKKNWKLSCLREREIIRRVRYHIGRTAWDERVTKILNPQAKYYYGGEILRSVFYSACERHLPRRFTIVSTISSPYYKGYDLTLKTAQLMKDMLHMDFTWLMYGNIDPSMAEKRVGIRHEDVGIKLCGVVTAETLRDSLLSSSAYVHTSYIDNSPNSLCEAQILGCPSVVTFVGGVPSLIDDGNTGYCVPANDPYQMAYLLHELAIDRDVNIQMGNRAKAEAIRRHNPETIIAKLVNDYRQIIADYAQLHTPR